LANDVEPLALERVRRAAQPLLRRALRAALKRKFDEAGITPVQAAQQVHRVGKVAAGMPPRRLKQ
jgi:hypothetical protein